MGLHCCEDVRCASVQQAVGDVIWWKLASYLPNLLFSAKASSANGL